MPDDFEVFASHTEKALAKLFQGQVFVTDTTPDQLWEHYLRAFPEGTNPIFRKRTEHDCACCRGFIKNIGNLVTIKNGKLHSFWGDVEGARYPYNVVAEKLRELVEQSTIVAPFMVSPTLTSFGSRITHSLEDGRAVTWKHFYTPKIPANFIVRDLGERRGAFTTNVAMLQRALTELDLPSLKTILELIDQNSIYRGQEHRSALVEFTKAKQTYEALGEEKKTYPWTQAHSPVCRFRNTVIGSLAVDLSGGRPLDEAVASFEAKVAPQNYKRTTALITPMMVQNAMRKIEELGLATSLERRFAVLGDIDVKDVLWVDGAARPLMKNNLMEALMDIARKPVTITTSTTISMRDFIDTVLPKAKSLDVMLTRDHLGNFMSLTAPKHENTGRLFRWNNDFAWSYSGNVADSIKERVKAAGGNVTAPFRVSLSWHNGDDLDLHILGKAPNGTYDEHINFRNKRGLIGVLDVDMNAGGPTSRTPVENVCWATIPTKTYEVRINQFCQRERVDVGFTIEIEHKGKTYQYSYDKFMTSGSEVTAATIVVSPHDIKITSTLQARDANVTKWGITTGTFTKVLAATYSPNYWGENHVGNKHFFMVLDKARNDEPTRGIYNEFLNSTLEPHRKVFELIGEKTKCEPTNEQLSGVGFSSTKPQEFMARVHDGKRETIYTVYVVD